MLCPYVWAFIKYFRLLERMQLLEGQMHVKCGEVQNGGRAMFTCTSTSSTTNRQYYIKTNCKAAQQFRFYKKQKQTTLQPNSSNKDPTNESVESKQKALEKEH